MPPAMRKHVRYPELLLKLQATVYGLYHMTDPGVFYNREDLWSVASEGRHRRQTGEQATQTMEPNFVLMTLPGEKTTEFIEILPFTPANRNNLIGWIAGRSDDPNYGTAVVYDFPKTRLVDGPLQVEARIDQNAQLSGQLSLWNQQGSHVRRGSLIVIPGRTRAALRRADLPAGRAQPDAGAAARRPRAAGSAGVRTDVRSRRWPRCSATASRRCRRRPTPRRRRRAARRPRRRAPAQRPAVRAAGRDRRERAHQRAPPAISRTTSA